MALLCCILVPLSPTMVGAAAALHAQEHRDAAAAGTAQPHRDDSFPHHDHDQRGDPIPATTHQRAWMARPANGDGAHVAPVFPAPLAIVAAADGSSTGAAIQCPPQRRGDSPRAPGPGDTLPLLI